MLRHRQKNNQKHLYSWENSRDCSKRKVKNLDTKQAQIKPKPALRAVIAGRHKSDGPLPLLANLSVEYSKSSTSCLNLTTSSHHIRTQTTEYICISVLLVRWRILLLNVQTARVKTKAA